MGIAVGLLGLADGRNVGEAVTITAFGETLGAITLQIASVKRMNSSDQVGKEECEP